jgi:hypothetical protein
MSVSPDAQAHAHGTHATVPKQKPKANAKRPRVRAHVHIDMDTALKARVKALAAAEGVPMTDLLAYYVNTHASIVAHTRRQLMAPFNEVPDVVRQLVHASFNLSKITADGVAAAQPPQSPTTPASTPTPSPCGSYADILRHPPSAGSKVSTLRTARDQPWAEELKAKRNTDKNNAENNIMRAREHAQRQGTLPTAVNLSPTDARPMLLDFTNVPTSPTSVIDAHLDFEQITDSEETSSTTSDDIPVEEIEVDFDDFQNDTESEDDGSESLGESDPGVTGKRARVQPSKGLGPDQQVLLNVSQMEKLISGNTAVVCRDCISHGRALSPMRTEGGAKPQGGAGFGGEWKLRCPTCQMCQTFRTSPEVSSAAISKLDLCTQKLLLSSYTAGQGETEFADLLKGAGLRPLGSHQYYKWQAGANRVITALSQREMQAARERWVARGGGVVMIDGRHDNTRDAGNATMTVMCADTGEILYQLTVYTRVERKKATQLEMIAIRRWVTFMITHNLWRFVKHVCHDNCSEATKLFREHGKESSLDLWHGGKADAKHFTKLAATRAEALKCPTEADTLTDLMSITIPKLQGWVIAQRSLRYASVEP